MLDAKFIRENLEGFRKSLKKRFIDVDLDKILALDEKFKKSTNDWEKIRRQANLNSEKATKIVQKLGFDKARQDLEWKNFHDKAQELREKGKTLWKEIQKLKRERDELLLKLPNLVASNVPKGRMEEENVEIKKWGKLPKFDFKVKDHVELGESLDIIDFEAGAKVSGSRFYYLKNQGAILALSLINFSFEFLIKKGFTPVTVPLLVKEKITTGTGFRPRSELEEQVYKIEGHDLYLIATTEVSLLGLHADEIFQENDLPKFYVGASAAFRTEAGSWGKDVRGILRTHQFEQTEMFGFCTPANSEKIHQQLLSYEEEIYQALEIPYRVVNVCAGDLGSPAYKKYDIEAWIPSQNRYREITSCSNTTDFQARRLNIKYRSTVNGKSSTNFVHTLNATAVAVGRTLIAILENYQQKDGSVLVPKALQKYLDFESIKPKKV